MDSPPHALDPEEILHRRKTHRSARSPSPIREAAPARATSELATVLDPEEILRRRKRSRSELATVLDPEEILRRRKKRRSARSPSPIHEAAPAPATSELATVLLSMLAWGLLSSNDCQKIARAGETDGIHDPLLHKIASAGNSGVWPANCRRDILGRCCSYVGALVPTQFQLQYKKFDLGYSTSSLDYMWSSLLNPLQVIEVMFQKQKNKWQDIMQGCRAFWSNVHAADPKLRNHPVLKKKKWQHRCIPIIFWGDGAEFSKKNNSSLVILAWKPLVDLGYTLPLYLLTLFTKQNFNSSSAPKEDTQTVLWSWVHFFLQAFYRGVHPPSQLDGSPWPAKSFEEKWAGQPLCDGECFGMIWDVAADWVFYAQDLGLPSPTAKEFCWLCKANRHPMEQSNSVPWTDFSDDAVYLTTFDLMNVKPSDHILWTLPGLSRFMALGDWMHTVDQGVGSHLCGSCCFDLWSEGEGTQESRLKQLWASLKEAYAELGLDVPKAFKLRTFFNGSDAYCILAGIKANDTKHMVYALHNVLHKRSCTTILARQRRACFDALVSMYNSLSEHGLFFPDSVAKSFLQSCKHFLQHYAVCAQLSRTSTPPKPTYNLVPKFHLFLHIAYYAQYQSPRATWTYEWESFAKVVLKSAKMCMAGTPTSGVPNKVLENHCLALGLIR